MKRQMIRAAVLGILALTVTACGGKNNSTVSSSSGSGKEQVTSAPEQSEVSFYDMSRKMLDAAKFGEMSYVSSAEDKDGDSFRYLSDTDYSLVKGYFLAYAKDGAGNADEVAVVEMKDDKGVATMKAALDAHLAKRKSLYETYDTTQLEKLGGAMLTDKGNFVVLIISDDNKAVYDAFESFVK